MKNKTIDNDRLFVLLSSLSIITLLFETSLGFTFRAATTPSTSTTISTTVNKHHVVNHHHQHRTRFSSRGHAAATTFNDFADVPFVPPSNDDISSQASDTKIGVLLLNLGGPETGEDVESFLYNLFADPDIIRLPAPLAPLQSLIARGISKRRAPKSREAYRSIGGGSPILRYSNAQADLLKRKLDEKYGVSVETYVAMRYWRPFTEEALERIRTDGIEALVVIPLYPQFSISTSGSSLRKLAEEFAKEMGRQDITTTTTTDDDNSQQQQQRMVHTVVPNWHTRPGYIRCMANLISEELNSFTPDERAMGPRHVLFSAHGVPRSYIDAGDPYQRQIEECVGVISRRLPSDATVHLSYQSRVGPIEWLRPYTDDVLPRLGKEEGVKNLVVVPISFVSEHIETLEEIDIEYRELAEESGIVNWRRCPALNTDEGFIEDMADMTIEALMEPVQTVTEACISNNVENVGVEVINDRSMGISRDSQEAEKLNGRIAMLGVATTMIIELINGKSLLRMFGL